MAIKIFLLNLFFVAAAQATEAPQYNDQMAPHEVPPPEAQAENHEQPPPDANENFEPPPEDFPVAEEPPPPDFYDPSEQPSGFGREPTTPYKALKIIKRPRVQKVSEKRVAAVVPQRILTPRSVANAPAKKKIAGIKSVKPFCSMRALANSKSKELGKTRGKSRLWVEEVNSSWFKIYRRAGAAFIQASCLR